MGLERVFPEPRDLTKIQCGIRETLTGYIGSWIQSFDCYPGSRIRQNLGKDAGMGKKTIFGIAMKKVQDARECRIRVHFQSQILLGQRKVAII